MIPHKRERVKLSDPYYLQTFEKVSTKSIDLIEDIFFKRTESIKSTKSIEETKNDQK